jgi:succinate-semialdehyde dehydrogenase / glutarate-semialdehyde dehydrogenase
MKFKKFSPLTGDLVREYDYASPGEVDQALSELHHSYRHWKNLTPAQRQQKLFPLIQRMTDKKSELAETMSYEMGKLYAEAAAEVEKCIKTIDVCLKMDLSFLSEAQAHSIYKESSIVTISLGVIYAIMPWNFPLWQAVRMMIPALLSGNVILLKHSEINPETGRLIEELFSGVCEHTLVLHRLASHEQTEKILSDDRVQGVSLTGSTRAGLTISSLAAKYLKKCVLELGGSDPYIVFSDADLAAAAKSIAKSRLQNTGQSCIAAKRCLVHRSVQNEFLELLKAEFARYDYGHGKDLKASLGSLADVKFKKSLQKQLQDLTANTQAELIFDKPHNQSEKSAFVNAQIYLLNENSDWLKDQEFFAPVLLVIPFQAIDEAIDIANSTSFGLGAGVFSKNLEFAKRQAAQIDAGQVAINDFIKSDVMLPFGGMKMSGLGRELGKNGFLEFTTTKVISNS